GSLAGAILLAACGAAPAGEPPSSYELTCPACVDEPGVSGTVLSVLVDMGEVSVGDEATRTITLVNEGRSVNVAESSDDLTPFSTDLACGSGCAQHLMAISTKLDIHFTFSPTSEGTADRSVTFRSAAGAIYVHLVGKGVIPDVACAPGDLDFGPVL